MEHTRRAALRLGMVGAAFAQAQRPSNVHAQPVGGGVRDEFPGVRGVYLNCASVHPLTRAAAQAMAK